MSLPCLCIVYVGSTVVYPYNDTNIYPAELGDSIYVEANKNLWRAAQDFSLGTYNFLDDEDTAGFWDGEQFVFSVCSEFVQDRKSCSYGLGADG